MKKIATYIFNLSPKKLAVYLVLCPFILALAHTTVSISFRTISQGFITSHTTATILLGVLFVFFGVIVLLWLFWLRSVVYDVRDEEIGLPLKWFKIAFIVLWIFIIFNLLAPLLEPYFKNNNWRDYLYLIYAPREFINFGGIVLAYPVICHYAGRAIVVKRSGKPATFVGAIPFTLLLIFGTVLGIPFVHKYFSSKESTNPGLLAIYAIGLSLFLATLIIGFIAAITGII